jgi:hypothetical protein
MPISFDNAGNGDMPGVIGFLRLLDEEHGAGIRAALFAASAQDVPLEFCFTRADFGDSVLWRKGEARRIAEASLIRSLFNAANRTPDIILGLADEIPPLVFSEDIRVDTTVCRVSTDPAPRRGASEEIEQLGSSLFLVWSASPPDEGSVARRLLNVLAERPNPLEPFDRVAAGIAEAYEGR